MPASEWLNLLGCLGILALALLVLQRRSANPLGWPLGLWALSLFGWNFASVAYRVSGASAWHFADLVLSPWTPPLALQTVVTFVGRARRLGPVLTVAYVAFGLLSLWAAVATVSAPARTALLVGDVWSVAYVALWAPLLVLCIVLLVRHLRGIPLELLVREQPLEQARARLLLAALLIGGLLGVTELWHAELGIPALGALGSFGSAAVVSTMVLRFRLLGRELPSTTALYLLAIAALGTLGYFVVARLFAQSAALLVLGAASVTAVLAAAVWDAIRSANRAWSHMKDLALLGRFSAQLAHDIKNPLAAIHGAVQYLDKEASTHALPDACTEMLTLMAEQVARLRRVVDKYQRLGRLEPERCPTDVNELVADVLGGSALAALERPGITIEQQLGEGLPQCSLDRDLFAAALENVVSNAFEAMPAGGLVRVRTGNAPLRRDEDGVVVWVEDSGEGMDARQLARASQDFVSGKGSSGLGLGFVQMVLDAHGGQVRLTSTLGKGTVVALHVPAVRQAEELSR